MTLVKQIIPAFYTREQGLLPQITPPYLEIAEFFCDTIQGEGVTTGQAATFLRMKGCTQSCVWCDTKEVWRYGNAFTFDEIFILMERYYVIEKLMEGQHLILTGGSPLRQQNVLVLFINEIIKRYNFKPIIQVENECTLFPTNEFAELINIWNNSPKLSSSGNKRSLRYQPDIIKHLSVLPNSWFKFVVGEETDWEEIENDFLNPGIIQRWQIILMPRGATRVELESNRELVINMAVRNNVRYSTREHIIVWDKKTGI